MTAESTIRAYYDALRAGEPLAPFFTDGEPTIKIGISERLVGLDAVETDLGRTDGDHDGLGSREHRTPSDCPSVSRLVRQ
jgi:hypothetical protein